MSKRNDLKEVIPNEIDRTFILVKDDGTTYQTCPYSKTEFEDMKYDTLDDWHYFLRVSGNYYRIKK